MDVGDLKTMPPTELHEKKVQIKRGGHSKEKHFYLYSHARQVKSTKREPTSGENLNIPQKKKPKIQIQMSKLDKISGVLWRLRMPESCCSKNETLCSEGRFSPYL